MAGTLRVEVVAAERIVWEGDALSVIARTTEGDIGILPDHEPLLAVLVACAAEVLTPDGRREIMALDGGFLSVAENRVGLLSQYATLAREISLPEAERELAQAEGRLNDGDLSEATRQHFQRASAQVRAARMAQEQR